MASGESQRYGGALVVLSDSTAPVAFCRVGAGQPLLDYLAPSLIVAREVLGELRRNVRRWPGLRLVVEWVEKDEDNRVHDLTAEHALEVTDFLRNHNTFIEHPNENLGEVATVYAAIELVERGQRPLVCMDDHVGKGLCRASRLDHADTPALLLEMVCAGAITFRVGQRIWQNLFNDRGKWRVFRERVEAECPAATCDETAGTVTIEPGNPI